ncbi:TAP26 protein, partial [Amia calva]|nr:TAP26 protein [Amia calva]
AKNKRKWVADESKVFAGSIQEGQGFAFKRKQKVQYEYKKLLRKEKRSKPQRQVQFTQNYPDHLKHLYLAEEELLKKEEQKSNLRRHRERPVLPEETVSTDCTTTDASPSTSPPITHDTGSSSTPPAAASSPAPGPAAEPHSDLKPKKNIKKTSYQKTRDEYERIQAKRAKKREEAEKNKKQREEALRQYKQKKMQNYQILSKKTKRGQPNLNLQMEYLLQKIQ